jgi:hypothetical protein
MREMGEMGGEDRERPGALLVRCAQLRIDLATLDLKWRIELMK